MAYNKKNSYKGKKTNSNAKKDFSDKRSDKGDAKFEAIRDSRINDLSHHAKDMQLLSDAASFAYSQSLGTPFTWEGPWTESEANWDAIPGVCALVCHPMIGHARNWNDSINIASRALYSWIRHANSGHANYDAPDLAMYIYAMAQIDSMIEWAKRLYGLCANYSFKNRYMPKALVEANGVDFEDLSSNLANYRYRLNLAIRKRNSLAVPKNMAVYQRQKWMYSGVYRDANNPKSQVYMFVPDGFYMLYGPDSVSDATHLSYVKLAGDYGSINTDNIYKWSDVVGLIDFFIQMVWGEEDFNIMSGDILKAYGAEGVETVFEITDDFTTNIGYEFEVLSEIQNATILRANVKTPDLILQDTDINGGEIYYEPKLIYPDNTNGRWLTENRMLTVPYPDPKPGDTMIASRLTVIPKWDEENKWGYFDEENSCGTEIVTGMRVANLKRENGAVTIDWEDQFGYAMHPDVSADYFSDFGSKLGDISRFDYHPAINVAMTYDGTTLTAKPMRFFDVDNYTIMEPKDLAKMHKLSVWTQFDWA